MRAPGGGRASPLDLGPRSRRVFAGTYLLAQLALIFTAGWRPDGIFAFHMFDESSTMGVRLSRRVRQADGGTEVVPTDGTWLAADEDGAPRTIRWNDRVKQGFLAIPGPVVRAVFASEARLFFLQKALDDVVCRAAFDDATVSLIADVWVVRNGGAPEERRLESVRRPERCR